MDIVGIYSRPMNCLPDSERKKSSIHSDDDDKVDAIDSSQ